MVSEMFKGIVGSVGGFFHRIEQCDVIQVWLLLPL